MRPIVAFVVLAAAAVAPASPAHADDNVVGTFDVKFDEMAQNCSPPPVSYGRTKMTIEIKKNSLTVNTDLIPQMVGVPAKGGKINVKTLKVASSSVQGLDAKYSAAGHIEDGVLSLVLVAEYINEATKKPYCTQSWNVSGVRSDGTDKKPAKP